GFFINQELHRLAYLELAAFLAPAAQTGEHAFDLLGHFFHARWRHDFHVRRGLRYFDFDFAVIQRTFSQALAESLARIAAALLVTGAGGVESEVARRRYQDIEHALFGSVDSAVTHLAHFRFASLLDADFGEVADDGIHIASHIADLGKFGGFDLDERCIRQLGQASRDLGLAYAGGTYHQDILW